MAIGETVIKLWNGWDTQVLVLVSLSLQVILIALGSKRKSTTSTWINFLVWSAYLSADWVATIALGILARSRGCNSLNQNHSLQSFWAPFLLLHLGGPDTITAYSLEDNELWLRHLVGLVFEIGVAIYVLFRSWVDGDTTLSSIAIPVFIAGIIKYGERTYVLMSSSTKWFRTSSLDNLLHLNEYDDKQMLGPALFIDPFLLRVDRLFKRLKFLFADLMLDQHHGQRCKNLIRDRKPREAFELVEFELGLLYDLLYTKGRLVYSCFGIFLRCITCLASVSALVTFSIIIDVHEYSPVDIFVTYLLLVGAVVLEVYALLMLTSSDGLKLWLVVQKTCYLKRVTKDKRWCRSIGKYNLMKFCLKKQTTMWIKVQKLLGIYELLEEHQNLEWQQGIDDDLKCLIFHQLGKKANDLKDIDNYVELCSKILNYRGDCVLGEMNCLEHFKWSIVDVEFDESVLLWHIATQLCYHDDNRTMGFSSDNDYSKISRCLSEYMLYLLVMCPNMLPKGFGYIRYKKACEEVIDFIGDIIDLQIETACQQLLSNDATILDSLGSKFNILSKGLRLAKQLQNLNKKYNWESQKKWEMMDKVWVELLTYAASHCGWKEHGQQLAKGGELLTHVCLLMAHFGISRQYQFQLQLQLPKPEDEPIVFKRQHYALWKRIINCSNV